MNANFLDSWLVVSSHLGYEEIGKPAGGSSLVLTIWNVLPLLQGNSALSMPYCIVVGGYVSLLLIPLISIMATMSGKVLIDCMYDTSEKSKVRVRKDYAEVAGSVWGRHGARLFNAVLLFFLFFGDVLNIVLLGRSVYDILSPVTDLSFYTLTSLSALLCYPTLFIRRLNILAYLSFLSVISVLIAFLATFVVIFTQTGSWSSNFGKINFINIDGLPLSASIIMLSSLIHSVLPRVERDMTDPSESNRALYISYSVSAFTKTCIGLFGAITFGRSTDSIITINAGEVNDVARYVCAIALILFAILNYPLNLFIVCETVDTLIEDTKYFKQNRYYYTWMAITRFLLLLSTVLVGLFLPYFGLLSAIRGSLIGTCLLFIFPCIFHLCLKWHILTHYEKGRDIVLLVAGTVIGVLGLYSSLDRLIEAVKNDQQRH